mmetsp:Transcript_22552/g.28798  ORF Transcript_22552/g.28798 Transcript_22552/m.28798 type:complete len:969 (-) Transcript_22552:18-2924(-)
MDDSKRKKRRVTASSFLSKRSASSSKIEKKNSTSDIKVINSNFEGSTFQSDDYEASDCAYRKAYNSMKIEDIFDYLQCIVQDENSRKKKLANQAIPKEQKGVIESYMESRRLLVKRISKFINVVDSYKNTHPETSYAELFHRYMRKNQITEENNFLTAEKIYGYKQLLSVYVNSPFIKTEGSSKLEEKARELFQFFEQFRVDCYSCLTGLVPSDAVVDLLLHNKTSSLFEPDAEDIGHTATEMYHEIVGWASSSDSPADVLSDIKKFAAILRGVNKLKAGDVVVAEYPAGKYKYARYSGLFSPERGVVYIWVDASQNELCLSIDHVWPLPGSVIKFIAEHLPKDYERLVSSPVDPLFSKVMKYNTNYVKNKISELGLDNESLIKANQNQCSILDLSLLRDTLEKFLKLIPPSQEMLQEVQSVLSADVAEFTKDIERDMLFQPTADQTLQQIESLDFEQLLSISLNSYKGVLQSALDHIALQKRDLLNGTRKNQLVEWWLQMIRNSVLKRLTEKKFDKDAVSRNYTVEPPKDFRQVYKNIGILREALDLEKDIYNIKQLIDDVCGEVYPKIEAFIVDSKVAILEYLKKPCDKEAIESFDNDAVKMLIEEAEQEGGYLSDSNQALRDPSDEITSEDSLDWLKDLLADIVYLQTMKDMETASIEERKKNFHIVPISGLIISRLCRMENEHKTVLELWAPVAYVSKLSGNYKRSSLHRAISINDFKAIKGLLRDAKKTTNGNENEQDHNGWTPLHCAASAEDKIPVCKVLIEAGASVNIANNDGNTPLHYLARCSVSNEDMKQVQLEILQLMILNGGDVNAVNDLGETPLHASCFLGDVNIATVLLEAYADPNSITKEGESALHYAVQARHPDLVELLLEYGANPYFACGGVNPIDLAYKFHVPEITEIFRSIPMSCSVGSGETFAPRNRSQSRIQFAKQKKASQLSMSSPVQSPKKKKRRGTFYTKKNTST